MKKTIALLLMTTSIIGHADTILSPQAIDLEVQLKNASNNPTYWMVVQDPTTGAINPFMLAITEPHMHHLFKTDNQDYKIIALYIQSDLEKITPCKLTQEIVHGRATRIILQGTIDDKASSVDCNLSTVLALPLNEVSTPPASNSKPKITPTETTPNTPDEASNTSNKYEPIINYLQALKSCKKSQFNADIDDQKINYTIKGEAPEGCAVDISIDGVTQKPIICQFSKESIMLLTSARQIKMYQSGKINLDASSIVTKVMDESCG